MHVDAVDAVPEQLDKGWALDILSDILNIGKSDFVSVGDSDSDIPMLSKTGLSICVGSNPNLRKMAHKTFATEWKHLITSWRLFDLPPILERLHKPH